MTKKKNTSAAKKLIPAAGMLAVSTMMLATSTYAWFTMNKEVSVTGMQMKAQAEKGLLINEMAGTGEVGSPAVDNGTYAVSATAGQSTAISLRPASTSDLTSWYHANSKNSSNEAGADANGAVDTDNTVLISAGKYYDDISPA
ncbi:MAG: PPC domain-containing protein, partial [Oscillospiraceae bacterium]|nr:PPC domain-containing protein [Oscillospiraceae bacterium]